MSGMDAMIQGMMMGKLDNIQQQQKQQMLQNAENERINAENQRIYDDLLGKYNELAYDTHNFAAQRDEAVKIFEENRDILPFTPEQALARMRAKGFEVENEIRNQNK